MKFVQRIVLGCALVLIWPVEILAQPVGCWRSQTMVDANGLGPHTDILDPATLAPHPSIDESYIMPDTDLSLEGAKRDVNGRAYLIGTLWFRQEKMSEEQVAVPQDQFSCQASLMAYSQSGTAFSKDIRERLASFETFGAQGIYSVRYAAISRIMRSEQFPEAANLACIRFAAKGRAEGGSGYGVDALFVSQGGRRIWRAMEDAHELCATVGDRPFPELGPSK